MCIYACIYVCMYLYLVPCTRYQVPWIARVSWGWGDVSQLRYILGVPIKVYFQYTKIYLGKIYLTGCQNSPGEEFILY